MCDVSGGILHLPFGCGVKSENYSDWTEESVSHFLEATLPPDTSSVRDIWRPCVPLLYDLLVKFGNFPFHVNPLSQCLTYDVFCTAIIKITFRQHDLRHLHPSAPKRSSQELEQRFQRLLFQCLMKTPHNAYSLSTERTRNEADDEDLEEALTLVSNYNHWVHHDYPKLKYRGPTLPKPSSLLSSWTTRTSGTVAVDNMKVLIRLLLSLQLVPD